MSDETLQLRAVTGRSLRSLLQNNVDFFKSNNSAVGERFHNAFSSMLLNFDTLSSNLEVLEELAPNYDLNEATPGNGFRSFIIIADACIMQCLDLCRAVCDRRNSLIFFWSDFYSREALTYNSVLETLNALFKHLKTLHEWLKGTGLYPEHDVHDPEELLLDAEKIDTTSFYGRAIGFQYCESMRNPLKFITLAMAGFSDIYYGSTGPVSRTAMSLLNCGRYAYDPELRASRVVQVQRRASVDFCKSFWFLQEVDIMQQVPSFVSPQVAINKVMCLQPDSLQLPSVRDPSLTVTIDAPSAHIGVAPVMCRLLCAKPREGQIMSDSEMAKYKEQIQEPSPCLLIHCHGGGFVAQSSKSQEVFLRDWAVRIDCPILSIDYSLSPQAPFPRALEECLYAYAWAIEHCEQLGTTAERICLVGDSAGGNLVCSVALKCVELGIRPPNGLLLIYTPLYIDFVVSPARMLCLVDPLLPFGFMMRCLKAYADTTPPVLPDADSVDPPLDSPKVQEVHQSQPMLAFGAGPQLLEVKDQRLHQSDTMTSLNLSSPYEDKEQSNLKLVLLNGSTEDISKSAEYNAIARSDSGEFSIENIGSPPLPKSDGSDNEENVLFEQPQGSQSGLVDRLTRMRTQMVSGLTNILPYNTPRLLSSDPVVSSTSGAGSSGTGDGSSTNRIYENRELESPECMRNLVLEFKKFKEREKEIYLSPYLASDEMIMQMAPITFLSLALDPCLDDSVMFSRRLHSLGCAHKVTLDILPHLLPHGFLNFAPVSKEARDGSMRCVQHICRILEVTEVDVKSPTASQSSGFK